MHLRSSFVPDAVAAPLEYLVRKTTGRLGQPFNGQVKRQEIVSQIIKAADVDLVIETGSNIGTTTEYLSNNYDLPIYSCEVDNYFYKLASTRLSGRPKVKLYNTSSPNLLSELGADQLLNGKTVLLYLDAHWYKYLPLKDELKIVFEKFSCPIVLIDDFEVPDDRGYGFDDYGPEVGVLTWSFVAPSVPPDVRPLYPAAPSVEESGKRRGCVVLTSCAKAAAALAGLACLRQAGGAAEGA